MRKFVVGERYKVGDGVCLEGGNIIEITEVDLNRCVYKTVKGKAPQHWIEFFHKNSTFAKNLTLLTGEKKVVVLRSGNTVTATQYVDGAKVNTGVAKCCPEDTFNFETGAKLALKRLFGETESATETRFDWEGFKSGKFSVKLTEKDAKSFLEEAEKNGCKWRTGKKPTKFIPNKKAFYLECSDTEYGLFGWEIADCYGLDVAEW